MSKNNCLMTYDKVVKTSPFGYCWNPHLTKSTDQFGKNVFKVTLGLDSDDCVSTKIKKDINDFYKSYSNSMGSIPVGNKILYRSDKGNESITFSVKDKGQRIKCFNSDGEETEPPIDGDRIEVNYTFAGWCMDGKAGIKVYLDSVNVLVRSGTPKSIRPESDMDEGDMDY